MNEKEIIKDNWEITLRIVKTISEIYNVELNLIRSHFVRCVVDIPTVYLKCSLYSLFYSAFHIQPQ